MSSPVEAETARQVTSGEAAVVPIKRRIRETLYTDPITA
jgi:hypothetical protein